MKQSVGGGESEQPKKVKNLLCSKSEQRSKEVSVFIYSALFVVPHTQGAQAWITQCYLQLHQCLPLPRKREDLKLCIFLCGKESRRKEVESCDRSNKLSSTERRLSVNTSSSSSSKTRTALLDI